MTAERTFVAVAGLLHDVGKFRQRAQWGLRRSHQDHGAEWVRDSVVPRLRFLSSQQRDQLVQVVRDHHEPSPYARDVRVVKLADHLAAGERVERDPEEEPGDPSRELLIPVFTRLALGGRGLPETDRDRWVYRTAPLALDHQVILPVERGDAVTDYPSLWSGFENGWKAVPNGAPALDGPDAFALTWLSLLRAYAWCVPSAAYKTEPDISLADHLHVTGALAASLWDLGDDALARLEEQPFRQEPVALLVGGDLTGIQRFLYTISSSGAAKSLRGRSAYLSLVCEAVAEFSRRRLELPPCNVLYSSGGHFFLVAPLGAEENLAVARHDLNALLLDFFGGEVGIVLDTVTLLGSDFRLGCLGERWHGLAQRLRERKQQPWREEALADATRVFGPFGTGGQQSVCVVCHSEPDDPPSLQGRGLKRPVKLEAPEEAERKCSLCASFEDLSHRIARADYLVLRWPYSQPRGDLRWHTLLTALGLELWFYDHETLVKEYADGDWVVRLNSCDLTPVPSGLGQIPVVGFRFLPTFTPWQTNGFRAPGGGKVIRELGDLAKASDGASLYGSLRMDVDSLGLLFSEGLGDRLSFSRMMTLSRSLTTFFEGYINRICEDLDGKHRHFYLLYSGGDDLLAIGSWDRLLALAREVRARFRAYTCGNPCIALSGGTALHDEKFPLYQAAHIGHDLIEAAKAFRRDGREKDALGLWGHVMGWEDLEWAARWHGRIVSWLRQRQVSRSLVFRLARIAQMHADLRREVERNTTWTIKTIERQVRNERWQWILVYYLSKERPELQDELGELRRDLIEDGRIQHLRALSRWVELSTK